MTKTVVIHQPDFLPHLAFFHRFLQADLYVVLDTVQYVDGTSRSWMNRDKIKTPKGERWLTVSVKNAPRGTPIREIELSTATDWRADNLNLLRENYRHAAGFAEIYPRIEALYRRDCRLLADFNLRSIELLLDLLGIRIPLIMAHDLRPAGTKNALLVDLLRKVGATRYLSGPGARAYLDPAPFEAAGIEVRWHEFRHPLYPQLHGEFVPFLSSIDLLLNCGAGESAKLIRSCE
jgi:hypothetical protein